MDIIIVEDYDQLSLKAADIVAGIINGNRRPVLGLATGSTPEGVYARLVKMYQEKIVDFSSVITFNLDEYYSLPPDHPQSYYYYMYRHLFNHINIGENNIHIPSTSTQEVSSFCNEYDQAITEAGGIDLQILGIGANGHIGFNEPGKTLNVKTHLVDLTKETIKSNSRFFRSAEEVPRQAITMGMGSIMQARNILLLAAGNNKAIPVNEAVSGTITTYLPASFLQLHSNVTILIDREAASLIEKG